MQGLSISRRFADSLVLPTDGGAYAPIPGHDVEGVSLYRDLPSAYTDTSDAPSAYSEPDAGDTDNGAYSDNGMLFVYVVIFL